MHSRLYRSLDLIMALKTWIFHLMLVRAFFQNSFSLLQVAIQSFSRLATSALLLKESVRRVPRYVAEDLRGTNAPAAGPLGENRTEEIL